MIRCGLVSRLWDGLRGAWVKNLPVVQWVIQRERERWKINESNFRIRAFVMGPCVCSELEWESTG